MSGKYDDELPTSPATVVPDFPPHPAGTTCVAREMIATLALLPFVQHIALFGSLAEDRADCWSDVDLWVACEDVEQTQWIAAAAMRAAHPVLFYRMFSNAAQPAGRYWFAHASPFHKIDISFYPPALYHTAVSQPTYLGYPVTVREVFTRRYPSTSLRHTRRWRYRQWSRPSAGACIHCCVPYNFMRVVNGSVRW